jgi:hypothetical protein
MPCRSRPQAPDNDGRLRPPPAPNAVAPGAPVTPRPYNPNSGRVVQRRAPTIGNFVISPPFDVLYVLEAARKIYLMVGARV